MKKDKQEIDSAIKKIQNRILVRQLLFIVKMKIVKRKSRFDLSSGKR